MSGGRDHQTQQRRGGRQEIRVGSGSGFRVEVDREHAFFCPREDQISIPYTIHNDGPPTEKVRLEFYGTVQQGQLGKLFYWEDTDAWKDPGDHSWLWRGELQGELEDYLSPESWRGEHFLQPNMPHGYVTLAHSPYRVKVIVKRGSSYATGWSPPVHVKMHSATFELGPESWLSEDTDRYVYRQFEGEFPAPGSNRRIYLLCNQFKTDSQQMYDADAVFTRHRSLHGDGPRIPVKAKIWIKNAAGERVDFPEALPGAKFLWDVLDLNEGARANNDFVTAALDYDRASTQPIGDNCHTDRGGKRGASNPAYFEAVSEFPGEAAENRPGGVISEAFGPDADEGKAGRTGALFRPSRMGGDSFRVRVVAANRLNDQGKPFVDLAEAIPARYERSRSGSVQVWRRMHLKEYWCKDESLMATSKLIRFRDVIRLFNPAFLQLNPTFGRRRSDGNRNPRRFTASRYSAYFNEKVEQWLLPDKWALEAAYIPDPGGPFKPFGLDFFDVDMFFQNAAAGTPPKTPAEVRRWLNVDETVDASDGDVPSGRLSRDERREIVQNRILDKYLGKLRVWSKMLLEDYCRELVGNNGLWIFHFDGLHGLVDLGNGYLQGWAPEIGIGQTSNRSAFILCAPMAQDDQAANTITVAHEIGHLIFLPHADNTDPGCDEVPGHADDLHDSRTRMPRPRVRCLMGYESGRNGFCGLCQVRLRGWKIDGAIDPDKDANRSSSP